MGQIKDDLDAKLVDLQGDITDAVAHIDTVKSEITAKKGKAKSDCSTSITNGKTKLNSDEVGTSTTDISKVT